jgi:putative thiamine transport system ATP-binding protein
MTLKLDHVQIRANGRPLFAPLTLEVAAGQVTTLMASSGSGKSSILAYLCGTLDKALHATGSVQLDGKDVTRLPTERRGIGILFQDDLLFPHLSVGANLGFGLKPSPGRNARIEAALDEAELSGMADRDPATLSGGQRARAALMRCLLAEPRALLLDEPFSRLDADLRQRFRRFVFDHAAARGLPILLVTHDPMDAEAAMGPICTLVP